MYARRSVCVAAYMTWIMTTSLTNSEKTLVFVRAESSRNTKAFIQNRQTEKTVAGRHYSDNFDKETNSSGVYMNQ